MATSYFDTFRNNPTAGTGVGVPAGQPMFSDGRGWIGRDQGQPAQGQQGSTGQPYAMGQPQQSPYAPGQGGLGLPGGMPTDQGYGPPRFASQGGPQITPDQWSQQMDAKAAQYGQPMQGAPGGGQPMQGVAPGGGQPQQSPYALGGQPAASQNSGNPYLQNQQNAISGQVTNTLQRQILPGINRGAIAAGGYGGSRQGIAQGLAINGATDSIANATANLQGQSYEQDQNRANQMSIASMQDATQRYGMGNQYTLGQGNLALGNKQADQSYGLGMGNLGLGYQNSANQATANNQSFYTQQRGQDLQQQGQGFNQYLQGLQTQLGMGAQQTAIGQQQFNAPGNVLNQYAGMLSPFSGLNNSTSQTNPSTGGGLAGAAGGALTMAQIWSLLNAKRD